MGDRPAREARREKEGGENDEVGRGMDAKKERRERRMEKRRKGLKEGREGRC